MCMRPAEAREHKAMGRDATRAEGPYEAMIACPFPVAPAVIANLLQHFRRPCELNHTAIHRRQGYKSITEIELNA